MKSIDYEILKMILEADYVNTKVIAEQFKVSVRTVRYSLSRIRDLLDNYNSKLMYSNKYGYYFSKHDQIMAKVIVTEFINNQLPISNKANRELYLKGMIIRSEQLNITDIANDLFISTSSIQQDCNKICLEMPKVKIKANIISNEMNFEERVVQLVNVLISNSQVDPSIESTANHLLFGKDRSTIQTKLVKKLLAHLPVKIEDKDVYYQAFGLILFTVSNYNLTSSDTYNPSKFLWENLDTEAYEVVSRYLCCIGIDLNHNPSQVSVAVYNFLKNIEEYYNIDLTSNAYELAKLEQGVQRISLQVKSGVHYLYRHTSRMIRLYPYSFSIGQQLLSSIDSSNQYSRDQVALICEVIQRLLFESQNSKAIVFIADSESAVIASYKQWIQSKYTKNIRIIEVLSCDAKNYLEEHNDDIEFIVDMGVNKLKTGHETIAGDEKLSIDMLNTIDRMLSIENGNFIFFSEFLSQRMLKVFYNPVSFEELLLNCALALEKDGHIEDKQIYIKQCIERERVGTTYIGYKTMISHPIKYPSNANALFFTVLKEPIIVEGYEVALIINCAFKEIIDFDISRLFEIIMKIVEKEENNDNLISSKSEMELYINIRNAVIKI